MRERTHLPLCGLELLIVLCHSHDNITGQSLWSWEEREVYQVPIGKKVKALPQLCAVKAPL